MGHNQKFPRKWKEALVAELERRVQLGQDLHVIAEAMGTTYAAVRKQVHCLGLRIVDHNEEEREQDKNARATAWLSFRLWKEHPDGDPYAAVDGVYAR